MDIRGPSRRAILVAGIAIASAAAGSVLVDELDPVRPRIDPADLRAVLARNREPCIVLGESWCPHCRDASRFLEKRRSPCVVLEISTSAEARRLYDQLGRPGFPILLTRDGTIVGFSPSTWSAALRRVPSP